MVVHRNSIAVLVRAFPDGPADGADTRIRRFVDMGEMLFMTFFTNTASIIRPAVLVPPLPSSGQRCWCVPVSSAILYGFIFASQRNAVSGIYNTDHRVVDGLRMVGSEHLFQIEIFIILSPEIEEDRHSLADRISERTRNRMTPEQGTFIFRVSDNCKRRIFNVRQNRPPTGCGKI